METTTETYTRVIPRDFFNEAKLLKCMGLLSLKVLDGQIPCEISIEESGDPFNIQLSDEGSLYVCNYVILVKGYDLRFKTTYNSKSNYPFYCEYDYTDYQVFDESGNWHSEFIEFIKILA